MRQNVIVETLMNMTDVHQFCPIPVKRPVIRMFFHIRTEDACRTNTDAGISVCNRPLIIITNH